MHPFATPDHNCVKKNICILLLLFFFELFLRFIEMPQRRHIDKRILAEKKHTLKHFFLCPIGTRCIFGGGKRFYAHFFFCSLCECDCVCPCVRVRVCVCLCMASSYTCTIENWINFRDCRTHNNFNEVKVFKLVLFSLFDRNIQ